jgi:hypothetical protein
MYRAKVNTDRFMDVPDEGLFVAEASDLPEFDGHELVLVASDGSEALFRVSATARRDGDLVFWDLSPIGVLAHTGAILRIFND